MGTENHGWTLSSAAGEGWLNAWFGGTRSVVFLAVAVAAITAAALFEIGTIDALHDAELSRWRAGGSVLLVDSDGGIDSETCHRAASQPSILAAAALQRRGDAAVIEGRTATPLSIVEATPGILKLAPSVSGTSQPVVGLDEVLITTGTLSQTSLIMGDRLTMRSRLLDRSRQGAISRISSNVRVAGSIDAGVAGAIYDSGIVSVVVPAEAMEVCAILAMPGRFTEAQTTAAAVVQADQPGGRTRTRPFLSQSELNRDLVAEYEGRSSRWAWIATGITLAAIWGLVEAGRRSETGLYRSLGAGGLALMAVRVTELMCLLTAAVASSLAILVPIALIQGSVARLAVEVGLVTGLGAWSLTVAIAVVLGTLNRGASPLDLLRDRA